MRRKIHKLTDFDALSWTEQERRKSWENEYDHPVTIADCGANASLGNFRRTWRGVTCGNCLVIMFRYLTPDTSVDDVVFPIRACNAIRRLSNLDKEQGRVGIKNLGDLSERTEAEFKKLYKLGNVSIAGIQQILRKSGIREMEVR